MKRCAHCRGRFRLIRYTAYRALGSIIQFCGKKCEHAYFDKRRKEAQSWPIVTAIKKQASRANLASRHLGKIAS
jgi:hypothetical protein